MSYNANPVNLPLYPYLSNDQVESLCNLIYLEHERRKLLLAGTDTFASNLTFWRRGLAENTMKIRFFVEFRDLDKLGHDPAYAKLTCPDVYRDITQLLQVILELREQYLAGAIPRRKLYAAVQLLPLKADTIAGMCAVENIDMAVIEAARAKLVRHNTKLAKALTLHYFNNQSIHAIDDVLQEVLIALHAVTVLYRPRRGFKFYTYASNFVGGYIKQNLAKHSRLVHLSGSVLRLYKMAKKLRRQLGNNVSDAELAAKLGCTEQEIRDCVADVETRVIGWDTPMGDDEDSGTLGDFVADDSPNSLAIMENREQMNALQKALTSLEARDERIIRMRFGIGAEKQQTLDAISKSFGLSRERVRQRILQGLDKLRDVMTESENVVPF